MTTITALGIITDAMERCNRLSPGETLDADAAAFGFRRLNLLVDEMAAQGQFLFLNTLTSAAQTGNITLGVGSWAAIAPGDSIVSATANNLKLQPISMQQYNELYSPTNTGTPTVWAQDGLSTVYLYPVPTGQTIKLQTLSGVVAFSDQTTAYTVPDGYASGLGACLAVRIAPSIIGKVPPELIRAENAAMSNIWSYKPKILDVYAYTQPSYSTAGRILSGGF